jgi:dihydrodipicolinate synthase/N-acetylneuraminate lyase
MRFPQSILISCEIPWDEHEKFVEPVFRDEVQHLLKHGFSSLYIFGTAGEGYAVDTARFKRIVEVFFEETKGNCPFPQVGLIGLSTANVCERLEIAMAMGFRDFQVALPSWGALNDSEVLRFFRDVCLSHPEARFLHYNLMRSKRLLTGADYRRIADEVPNLVATKNTSPDLSHIMSLLRLAPELQHHLSEITFPAACAFGECSLLSSFASMFPTATKKFFALGKERNYDRLFRYQKDYLTAANEVIAPLIRHSLIDGAYDKTIARLGGFPMPLRLLSPYDRMPEEAFQESKRILDTKYAEWLN